MSDEPTSDELVQSKPLHVDWHVPSNMVAQYATLFLAQPDRYEVTLSFFQPRLPIVIGTPEERMEQSKHLDTIRADCVGQIVLSIERLPELIQVLQEGLENYRAGQKQLQGDEP